MSNTLRETWTVDEHDFPYGGSPKCRYEFLLRYAVLAPSGHNTQPWLFEVTPSGIRILADLDRALPIVDPYNRELTISCGCAIEFLCVAARQFNYQPIVQYVNVARQSNLLATFSLGDRIKPSELDTAMFHAIPNRHTNRQMYETTDVPHEITKQLRMLAVGENVSTHFVRDDEQRKTIARLVGEGDKIQVDDPEFRRELAAWIRPNRTHSHDGMPGSAHGVGDLASYLGPLIIRTFNWGHGQAAKDEQLVLGSPLLAILKTAGDAKEDWLNTGRALSLMLLYLTDQGVSASYLNQPIEVQDLRVAMAQEFGNDGYPQILLRIGYGPEASPTPRRNVEEVVA